MKFVTVLILVVPLFTFGADDLAPKDPGEAGKQTLLGIDSDNDGVRDDVEIWINNYGSNIKGVDVSSLRKSLKAYARVMQNSLKNKDSANLFDYYLEERKIGRCVFIISGKLNVPNPAKILRKEFYNTEERLMNYLVVQGSAGGKIIESSKLESDCLF